MENSSVILAAQVAAGDSDAPQAVVNRYLGRLLALVRPRISAQLGQRLDAEDVAQSTFRSFFRRANLGEFELGLGAPLWRLLSVIALNKLRKQAEHHTAAKRSYRRESPAQADVPWPLQSLADREPDPSHAAAVADELDLLLRELSPLAREVIKMRLAGCSHEEIASSIMRSERTVRRVMADVQKQWEACRDT